MTGLKKFVYLKSGVGWVTEGVKGEYLKEGVGGKGWGRGDKVRVWGVKRGSKGRGDPRIRCFGLFL